MREHEGNSGKARRRAPQAGEASALASANGRRSAARVREAQRLRMLAATAQLMSERGAQATTVTHIVNLAGVSRRTFYEHFEVRSACLLATIEQAIAEAGERVEAAFAAHERWLDQMRAGLAALLQFADEEPQLARLCFVESAVAGPAALARRAKALDRVARAIDGGRGTARRQPPPLTAESLAGGILTVIQLRLLEDRPRPLIELLNPLMSMMAMLYLGETAARRELSKPARPRSAASANGNGASSPLDGLNIRLTYRTLAVLQAIAAEPGLSNSEVGMRAGVADQGQISKLLARLACAGLLENTGAGHAMGAANAWQLTARGRQVESAVTRGSRLAWR